jgi:hypothetical protein
MQQPTFGLSGSEPLLKQAGDLPGQTLPAIESPRDRDARRPRTEGRECPASRPETAGPELVRTRERLRADGIRPRCGKCPAAVCSIAKHLGLLCHGLLARGRLLLFHCFTVPH